MDGLNGIFADPLPAQVFFYLSLLGVVVFGAVAQWAIGAPARRRAAWRRRVRSAASAE